MLRRIEDLFVPMPVTENFQKVAMRTLRRLRLVVLSLIVLVTGCKQQDAPPPPAPPEARPEVRVGYLPIADAAQLFIALDQGFFREEQIDVTPRPFTSGITALEALGTGDVQIAYSAVAPLILAHSRGLDFVALTGGPAEDSAHAEHAVLVAKEGPIQTPKDLEGRTVGIVGFRSIDEPFVKEWLQKRGVDVQKVRFVEVPFPQMETVLLGGRISAAASIEPFVTVARRNGAVRVLGYNYVEVSPQTEIGSYNARLAWVNTNPEAVRRFQRAMQRATEYANQNPDSVRAAISRYTQLDSAIVREMTLPRYTSRLTPEGLRQVADLMLKWTILDRPADTSQLIR